MARKYRTAYIVEHTKHSFAELLPLADKMMFITTGAEQPSELPATIAERLIEFDPDKDLIVPVGKVFVNILVGTALTAFFDKKVVLAVYQPDSKKYKLRTLEGEDVQG